eukprot:4480030-Pyramimonas_sp.AAC.1
MHCTIQLPNQSTKQRAVAERQTGRRSTQLIVELPLDGWSRMASLVHWWCREGQQKYCEKRSPTNST